MCANKVALVAMPFVSQVLPRPNIQKSDVLVCFKRLQAPGLDVDVWNPNVNGTMSNPLLRRNRRRRLYRRRRKFRRRLRRQPLLL
jgi:hypothetical protein